MAVGVVYRLEPVEIEVIQHERQLFRLADVQDSAEIALVEQAGHAVRVRHVLELDLLPDVLHDLHDLIDRAVRVPRDRDDGQDHVGVLRAAAILDLEIVVRPAQHAAQVFGRDQARELGVFRFGQRDIAFGDGLEHFRILSGGRIERLTEAQLAVAVAVGVQIDDGIAVDDAAHALQQAVALHLFALEAQPLLLLAPQAQLALHAQRQHHDDDGEDAERAERDDRRLLHAVHRAVHLVGADDADERPVRKSGRDRDQIIPPSLTGELRAPAPAELDAVLDVVHGAVSPFGVRVEVVQIGQALAQLGLRLEREHDVAVRAHDIAVALTAVHAAVDQIVDHVRIIADREAGIGHAVQRHVPAQRHGEHDLGHAVARRVGGDDRPALAVHLLKNAADAVGAAPAAVRREVLRAFVEQIEVAVMPRLLVGLHIRPDAASMVDVCVLQQTVPLPQYGPVSLHEQREGLGDLRKALEQMIRAFLIDFHADVAAVNADARREHHSKKRGQQNDARSFFHAHPSSMMFFHSPFCSIIILFFERKRKGGLHPISIYFPRAAMNKVIKLQRFEVITF